jgi:hypothetical protein
MMPKLLCATAIIVLSAELARAQVQDISRALPNSAAGYGYTLSPIYERPITAQDMREMEIERDYRAALSKIPNKKPPRDPWAGARQVVPQDRHRPQH